VADLRFPVAAGGGALLRRQQQFYSKRRAARCRRRLLARLRIEESGSLNRLLSIERGCSPIDGRKPLLPATGLEPCSELRPNLARRAHPLLEALAGDWGERHVTHSHQINGWRLAPADDAAWCGWTLQIEEQARALVAELVAGGPLFVGCRGRTLLIVWFGLLADYDRFDSSRGCACVGGDTAP